MENSKTSSPFEFLKLKPSLNLREELWLFLVVMMFVLTTLGYYFEQKISGTMSGYPVSTSILFVPIYEEILFRGLLLAIFLKKSGHIKSIAISSILFGIWHLKNIFWIDQERLISQILYTTLFFGPIAAWITLKFKSIWPAVILHYINNFGDPLKGWLSLLHR